MNARQNKLKTLKRTNLTRFYATSHDDQKTVKTMTDNNGIKLQILSPNYNKLVP